MSKPARERLLGLVGGAVFLVLLAGYAYLYFRGWEHPLGKLVGVYRHRVSTVAQFCEQLRGEDLFDKYNASSLSFDCEAVRNDFTSSLHSSIVADNSTLVGGPGPAMDEIVRLRLLGAWRERDVLHIANLSISDEDPFTKFTPWKTQMAKAVAKRVEPTDEDYCSLKTLQILFAEVWLHGGEGEDARLPVPGTKFQACKNP